MSTHQSSDKIGLWPLTSLVTGNLVGSGVYLLPTTLAAFGAVSLFGWMITSLGAILLSLIFAHLSSRIPKTGGPYVYAREAFGDEVGYYVCWGYWVLSWISNPALAIGAVGYISMLAGGFEPSTNLALEILIMFGITAFNLMGIKITGRAELFITMFKIIPLLLLPLVGLFFIDLHHFSPLNSSEKPFTEALNSVAFLTLWGFVGLETGTVPAGQVINASRTVPLAIVLGTSVAAAVYLLGTIAVMGIIPHADLVLSKAPYADAAQIIFGGSWGVPVAIAAVISCLGTLNGWTLIVGRIPYGAAQDGLFPHFFQNTTRQGTPYWGVIISSLCTVPLLLLSLKSSLLEQFDFILNVAVTLILLIYAVSVLAYFKILIRDGTLSVSKIMLGMGALAFSLWALWAASLKMGALSTIILACGIPMHIWMKWKKVRLAYI